MPNVTIFIPAGKMPPDQTLAEITDECTELCTGILRAALENVHVTMSPFGRVGGTGVCGSPVSPRAVAHAAGHGAVLDEVIRRNTGLTARIRCFGYPAANIHARN